MQFLFEKLDVYQKAIEFIDKTTRLTETFPRRYYFLSDQLNRAVLSIAANLAEGNGRFTQADKKYFFGIARGSIQECIPLLELARRRDFISQTNYNELRENLAELAKMLSGLIKGLVVRK
jgi:four helix bundle protein